jgi:hypothetical protein
MPSARTLACLILLSVFAAEIVIAHLAIEPLQSTTETTPVSVIWESPEEVCDAPIHPSLRGREVTCRPAPSDGYYTRDNGTKSVDEKLTDNTNLVERLGGNHTIERLARLASNIQMLEFSEEALPIESTVALILAVAYFAWALYLNWRQGHGSSPSDTSVTSNIVLTFS